MKKIIIIVVILLVIAGGTYFLLGKSGSVTGNSPQATELPTEETTMPAPTTAPVSTPTPELAPTPTPAPTTHNVSIQSFAFSQKSINIKKGDVVVWTNKDSAPHTVTGDNGGPASETLNNGGAYSFTFNTAGTFSYHCAFHPSMTGSVVVGQ